MFSRTQSFPMATSDMPQSKDNFDLGCAHTISCNSERLSDFGFIVLVALEIGARFVKRFLH